MTREEKLNKIFQQFDKSAKQFCEYTNGLFCEISSKYKGEEKTENIQNRFAKIYYNSFVVKFTYTAHAMLSTINSILSCSIYLDKNEDTVEIPLQLAIDYCNMNISTPLSIPYITNEKGIIQAYDCICDVLREMFDRFEEISNNPEYKTTVLNIFADEIKFLFDIDIIKEMNEYTANAINSFFALRFCSEAFINHIKGNDIIAVKQLEKIKKLTGYEKRMVNLWSANNQEELPDLSIIIANLEIYNEKGVQKANFKEFGAMFLSWLLISPVVSVVYLGIFFLIVFFEGLNSVYLMGPLYNFPYCILFGFVTAIVVSYFTRFKFYKWLYKKDYEKYCEMDYIQNGGGSDRIMKKLLVFLTVISIVGCLFLSKWNINFLSNGFVDNSKFLSLKGEYYSYSEVEKVYYKPNRVNGFDETIEFPSYVVVLKNGTEIDLYEMGEISDYEDKLINYLRDKGVKIESPNT